ncbi:MAG TPA: NADH:flavin oxidoreductase [Anaerolineales bacterium]|nr:NADH:flavin oxidoreductase [Anaerolineales bacterium]
MKDGRGKLMSQTDPLLQPFQLKHLTLKNRIMSTSHEPSYAEDAKPKLRYQLYQEEKAKGGVALTMFGGSANIAPDSPAAFGQIYVGDDSIIPYFQQMAERIHRNGAAVMCQITHMGRRTYWDTENWLPTIAPSPVREPAHRSIPKEMELSDIKRVIKAYGAAARRCQDGRLDGVEIEAYGHLFDSFWTPLVNRRADEYGGNFENRMRFSLEALAEIRKQVGDDFIVGIRMSGDESVEGGLAFEDCVAIARRLAATGMLDFLNVIRGSIATDEALSHVIPNMGTPSGPHLPLVAAIREEVDTPLFHAARIADVATARHAIRAGIVDMVGMTRALMADPHLVAKIERGEEDQIRPCVGMGYCIDRIYAGREALCIHNPATGREETIPHVIAKSTQPPRRVVIVGAGPAGLEAARVGAERGHHVVLFEANHKPGGQVQIAARAPRRQDIIGITDWLYLQVKRLGVEVHLNRYAEAADVLAENPDVVIIATGGLPNTGFLSEGRDLVTPAWDILSGSAKPAANVLFFDDHGNHEGYSCVEFIADSGSRMELVTPDRTVAQEIGGTSYPAYLKAFYDHGVTLTLNYRLTKVAARADKLVATLYNEYNKSTVERVVDQVVVENGTLPVADLYMELKDRSSNLGEVDIAALIAGRPQTLINNPAGRYQLFRVGDAVSSRNIHAAIYDAQRLCKDV